MSGDSATSTAPEPTSIWKVAAASFAGTAVEYYDFAIYGLAAALVFPTVFFAGQSPFVATVASFGTLAIGFLARPVGGIIFGHVGDRVGRKASLVVSLVLMGVATVVMGLLPGVATIGAAAPLLLILTRVVQGIAFGGEWGGAVLLAYEHAPAGQRGFFASLPQIGPAAGTLLGNLAFLAVSFLPDDQLLAWGWRVPFLFSAALVALGLVVRLKITESPQFAAVAAEGKQSRIPLITALRTHPKPIILIAGTWLGYGSFTLIAITYLVGYATKTVGLERSTVITALLITNVVQLFTIPLSGWIADRIGYRRIIMPGILTSIAAIFFLFFAINQGTPAWATVGYVVSLGLLFSVGYGAQPALFASSFEPSIRYSGMSLGYQTGNVLGSGLAPLMATLIFQATGTSYAIAGYVAVVLLLAGACLYALTSTIRRTTDVAGATNDTVRPDPDLTAVESSR